ncbi:semaphorin-4A [Hyperolius riggenbachi]|uniref:semaphorin-4A n=1 Tax=Hyperolius riggenbachi TaxID=752182 RepID=UPI0035A31992
MPPWDLHHWLVLAVLSFTPCLPSELLPRITFKYGDPARPVNVYKLPAVQNYDQLLLTEDRKTLYVGAREEILELSIEDPGNIKLRRQVSWPSKTEQINSCLAKARKEAECFNFIRVLQLINSTHLYVCGTNAFNPLCTYINLDTFSLTTNQNNETLVVDGKGQSPFDPRHKHTEIVVGGELYSGTMNNFMGNEPIILRTLGNRTMLKTDASLGWLHSDTSFAGSFFIPGSNSDGKVYFFFEETAKEFDFFDKLTVPRVARVCMNDVGGDKVLQKKWTTFLKAQLFCFNDNFPFNVLHHVALLYPEDPQQSIFYGVFSSQWKVGGTSSSAVCSFQLSDIEDVFDGNYKEQNKESSKWTRYNGPVSNPRPGSCSSGKFSDTDLNFMKDHFLMDEKVSPVGKRPLLIKHSVSYTRIAIDSVQALNKENYIVMFLGTETGALHKAVLVKGESHIIEELILLQMPEPIETLLMIPEKRILYVGTAAGILQVPVVDCGVYKTCFDCILARDPYCGWNLPHKQCMTVHPSSSHPEWLQDIDTGNPNTTCLNSASSKGRTTKPSQDSDNPPIRAENYTASYNTMLRLLCPQMSSLATYTWKHFGYSSEKQTFTSQDTLVVIVGGSTLGLYECWADENGFKYKVAQYWVKDPNGVSVSHRKHDGDEMSFSSDEPDYYKPFVAVTVLLVLALCACVCLFLYSSLDRINANRKIQGCSTPETEKLSASKQPEKTSLNGFYKHARNMAKPCCVPIGGADGKMDLDNNSVNLTANGGAASEDCSDV